MWVEDIQIVLVEMGWSGFLLHRTLEIPPALACTTGCLLSSAN
jgi:hypothetical protein